MQSFVPTDTQVDYATGIITLRDHFFNTGEELLFICSKSTFVGIGSTAMGIGSTESATLLFTDGTSQIESILFFPSC